MQSLNFQEDDPFMQSIKVKFIEAAKLNSKEQNSRGSAISFNDPKHPQHSGLIVQTVKRQTEKALEGLCLIFVVSFTLLKWVVLLETDELLGIPYVLTDQQHPYIPKHRIVHFDLKGAPPTVAYMKKVISLSKTVGATGLLLGKLTRKCLGSCWSLVF